MLFRRFYFFSLLLPAFACLLALAPGFLFAQNKAVFEASSSQQEVPVGYRFSVTFSLRDAEARNFKAPDFLNFSQVGPSEKQSGVTMFNGKTSVHQSWTFELQAVKEGAYTIGPATVVTSEGQTLRTKPLTVKVVPPQYSAVPRGANEDLFVTGEFSSPSAFVGQQVKYRIKVYTRLNVEGADLLELPKFDGFYSREMKRFDTRVQYQTIKGKKYAVRTLHEVALFPQAAGEIAVGAARLRFEVEKPGGPSTIFGPATTPMLLQTAPAKLKVKDLPAPVPAAFTGVVGQYEVKFSLDRDTLKTGDALTLLVEIEGTGDARRLAPPRLSLPPELETFDPKVLEEEEFESVERAMQRRVYEYAILPKQAGVFSLAPELIFFDPDSNRYVVRKPDQPLQFTVVQGQQAAPVVPPDSTGLSEPSAGFSSDWSGRLKSWAAHPALWLILIVPIALLLIWLFRRARKTAAPQAAAPLTSVAATPLTGRAALSNARRLLSNDSPRLFFDALYKGLRHWAAALLGVPAPSLTPDLLRERLTERRVSAVYIETLLRVWHTCEQAVFAGQYPQLDMDATWRSAEEAVLGIERELKI